MLSRTRLLSSVTVAATMAASLIFLADPSANAAGICTTAPTVNVTQSSTSTSAKSTATIRANPCDDGVEAGIETFIHGIGDVTSYGGDVKSGTSSVTGSGGLVKYGYRYWANKTGTAKWYNEWFV